MADEGEHRVDRSPLLADEGPVTTGSTSLPFEEQQAGGGQADDSASESVQQYEEIDAMDILYPKKKYKYYYNKELCKETKADGSTVFVRRAGKLVPLNSVLKSQKPSTIPVPEKTVELVYVYDGGKLLTLGGSLTKINPSNSDSVRARVAFPIGTPPIAKGQVGDSSQEQVNVVKINDDMAKFALSALQEVLRKENNPKEGSPSASVSQTTCTVPSPEILPGKEESKENTKDNKTTSRNWSGVSVKPTKTNILDIIAAKLAMSEDESDEKEEEETAKPKGEGALEEKEVKAKPQFEDITEDKVDKSPLRKIKGSIRDTTEDGGTPSKIDNATSDVKEEDLKKDSEVSTCFNKDSEMKDEFDGVKKESKIIGQMSLKINAEETKDETGDNQGKEITESQEFVEKKELENSDEKDRNIGKEEQDRNISKEEQSDCKVPLNDPFKEEDVKSDAGDGESELKENKEHIKEKNVLPSSFSSSVSSKGVDISEEKGWPPLSSSLGDRDASSSSQSEVSDKMQCKKEEESSSNTTDSRDRSLASASIRFESSKSRAFKKNMYRFRSLSREMKRLNMNFVNYVGEVSTVLFSIVMCLPLVALDTSVHYQCCDKNYTFREAEYLCCRQRLFEYTARVVY